MMNVRTRSIAAALMLLAGVWGAGAFAEESAKGPTPYPTKDADWPGKGPIRKFGWMDDNRKYYWTQRAKDQGAIVFAGDSLTGNWKNLSKAFAGWKVANRGIGGDTSRGLLFRFREDVLDLNPRAVVITIGTNDLTATGNATDAVSNIVAMLELIEKKDAALPVVLCTVPASDHAKAPVKADQRSALNGEIKKLAEAHKNVTVCDLYAATANEDGSVKPDDFGPDKLHLAEPGYEAWAALLTPIFRQLPAAK